MILIILMSDTEILIMIMYKCDILMSERDYIDYVND